MSGKRKKSVGKRLQSRTTGLSRWLKKESAKGLENLKEKVWGGMKPCPFCGRDVNRMVEQNNRTKYYVCTILCFECQVQMHECYESEEQAIAEVTKTWNQRVASGSGLRAAVQQK